MADVKKIATRESYGNTLTELGKEMPNLVFSRRPSPSATLTAASPKQIWWAWPPV